MRHFNKKWLWVVGASTLVLSFSIGIYVYFFSSPPPPITVAAHLTHEQYQQQKQILLTKLKDKGAPDSFAYLQEKVSTDPAIARDCHPLLHQLGHGAYDSYGGFSGAMRYQNELCNSGYTHGVIESHFKASTDIPSTVKNTCSPTELTFTRWQCFHGIGHGVMLATEKNITKSIQLCELLPDDFSISSCVNGVFMERFILVDHTGEHTMHDMPQISADICTSQPTAHKNDCYFYLPTGYLAQHPDSYAEALNWCKKSEKNYITSCISGVGSQTMKENITAPTTAQHICGTLSGSYQDACVRGAVGLYINHRADSEAAQPLCDKVFFQTKNECEQVINSKRQQLDI